MTKLSETDDAIAWLRQFEAADQILATELLDGMTLVSRDQFVDGLRALIVNAAKGLGRVGLYAEREVRKHEGIPNRLFHESRGKVRHAFGIGPRAVQPLRSKNAQVGSEALVAHLITELCRTHPRTFVSHPGPDQIRKEGIRRFFLVTDFIGTGNRTSLYLDSAWRIASVRSWKSFGLLRFDVVAYSGTKMGEQAVSQHRSRPAVHLVKGCPTIGVLFPRNKAERIRDLCIRYDPKRPRGPESLGFGGIGALLLFGHGCPNNAPRMLYKSGKVNGGRWEPLFRERVTAPTIIAFGPDSERATLATRLAILGKKKLAAKGVLNRMHEEGQKMALVLVALNHRPRSEDTVSRRTDLTIPEVRLLIDRALAWKWIDSDLRPNDIGRRELRHLADPAPPVKKLVEESEQPYYPQSLRAPRKV